MNNLNIYKEKLRESGLRPTRQRLKICEALFSPKETFHFTINDLSKIIEEKLDEKISLATVYNTVHAFKKNGYLKEIVIATDKSYFDTNTGIHSHFFDIKNIKSTKWGVSDSIAVKTFHELYSKKISIYKD